MTLEEIKQAVNKFQNCNCIGYENYFPLIAVEYAIKGELILLKNFCDKLKNRYGIVIEDFYYTSYYSKDIDTDTLFLRTNKGKVCFFVNDYVDKFQAGNAFSYVNEVNKKDYLMKKWKLTQKDAEEFLDIFIRLYNFFGLNNKEFSDDYQYNIKSNIGFNVILSFVLYRNYAENKFIFSKILSDSNFEDCELMNGYFLPDKKPKNCNFYYFKSVSDNSVNLSVNNNEIYNYLNEELIGKIATDILVDISVFSLPFQERIKHCDTMLKLNLDEERTAEIENSRKLERQRIMQFYNKFSELAALINNTNLDMDFKKIKFKELEKIIFKSYGLPNALGYIEFEDFFKNNMVLRMIDLSMLDLTNVDIRGMNFSGTNIHIDPQVIYNKDMTNVNATNVKFSPFFDSFDDVILDGAIINDHEANIKLDKVRSYNENTCITDEVIAISLK